MNQLTARQKKWLLRIIIAGAVYAAVILINMTPPFKKGGTAMEILSFALYVVPYLIVGYDVLLRAFRNIAQGSVFDEHFLMMIATFGAFGVREYKEATAVMLFYQIGELFQNYAVEKSRKSITEMMDIVPETANLEVGKQILKVDPDDVDVGSIIVIRPGERIPLDGVVLDGESMIDTAALTGESVPRKAAPGDDVFSGCVNGSGTLKVKTTSTFDNSTVSRILELVEDASMRKAKAENFITRFARYYTPVVTVGAVILALIPPIILGGGWSDWIQRACIFLIVSCPCALVISVPLGFFGGIGAASRNGVLVKGSNYLEVAADLKTVVFDKTGTITKGEFAVSRISPAGVSEEELLETAALAETSSSHPVAESIREACGTELDISRVKGTEEVAGQGIHTWIDGNEVFVGNAALMKAHDIDYTEEKEEGTVIYTARGNSFIGSILISDRIKEGAADAVRELKQLGVTRTVMLTGDRKEAAEAAAAEAGVDLVFSELLPADKVNLVEKLMEGRGEKEKLAFAGDGINDAPVLMRADAGIAMGSMGSDAAIEAADIVIMDDDLNRIGSIIRIARKTMRIVRQNIVFALIVKLGVLVLGAAGIANMWEAVFADVGVACICILNSMRTLNTR